MAKEQYLDYVGLTTYDAEIKSHIDDIAKKYGITSVIKIPFDKKFASLCDKGLIEQAENKELEEFVNTL